ncbi:MAG: hypothetical protein ABWY08_04495 [Comamonas sp.]
MLATHPRASAMSPAARRLRLLVLGAFAALAITLLVNAARRPAVLVVHSQSERLPWIQGIDAGIDGVLNTQSGVRLQRIYLKAHDTQRLSQQVHDVHGFIARWKPGAVITVDGLAQTLVGRQYAGHASPEVVYSGIEDQARFLEQSRSANVSGIAERTSWAVVEDTLVKLARSQHGGGSAASQRSLRVALINDNGAASVEQARGFAAHRWTKAQPVGVWRCQTRAQWIEALEHIAQHADVVLIGDYRAMPVPAGADPAAWRRSFAVQALAQLPQPMMALSSYAVEDGIPLAVLPSPMEQGTVASHQTLRALGVAQAPLARHAYTREFALVANTEAMAARQLSLGALDGYYARLSSRVMGADKW